MFKLSTFAVFCALSAVLFCGGSTAQAQFDDPVEKMELSYDINAARIVDDFVPVFLKMAEAESPENKEMISTIIDLTGVRSLDNVKARMLVDDRGITGDFIMTLDPEKQPGFLGRIAQIPQVSTELGDYLKKDDIIMFWTMGHFGKFIETLNDFAGEPQLRQIAPFIPPDPLAILKGYQIDAEKDILPYFAGEISYALFHSKNLDDQETMIMNYSPPQLLAVAVTDGEAVKEVIFNLLKSFLGQKADSIVGDPYETVGDYDFYRLEGPARLVVGDNYIFVTSAGEYLKSMLEKKQGDLKTKSGNYFAYLNVDALILEVHNVMKNLPINFDGKADIVDFLKTLTAERLGSAEFNLSLEDAAVEYSFQAERKLLEVKYRAIKELMNFGLKQVKKTASLEDNQENLTLLDNALTKYGEDFNGVFPENLEGLVQEGYIDKIPANPYTQEKMKEVPLGEYSEGNYTYMPLQGNDKIAGYYLFIYGGGEGTGYDVLTPENVKDEENFKPARDGIPDGLPNYAFGGIAIKMQEKFNQSESSSREAEEDYEADEDNEESSVEKESGAKGI